ncbi:hypothetical protein [Isoptericola sp. NPDC057391]|uniref:hypothetical protein n=1 Tax=Isoptericola sp. NPDC057391 TaxID=3346117 RepID=UPI0036351997
MLLELRAWIDDPRPYVGRHHKRPWSSLAKDVIHAIDTVGPGLRSKVPDLGVVRSLLLDPEPGASSQWRADCGHALASVIRELEAPAAAVAAFDDLHAALVDPACSHEAVESLRFNLDAALRCGGRALSTESSRLAGVLSDDALWVESARAAVSGGPVRSGRRPNEAAHLPEADRLALCRDLLCLPVALRTQVAWVCFERAHCRTPDWILPIGGVTFFDGPTLSSVLSASAAGEALAHLRDRLPAELLDNPQLLQRALDVTAFNDDLEDWVWVRVDLGEGPLVAPLQRAHQIAESLIDLAAFHDLGTHWRPMAGGVLVVDGEVLHRLPVHRSIDQSEHGQFWTSETLNEVAADLAPHVPAITDLLLELLTTARTVRLNAGNDANRAALLVDVQVIELVASMAHASHWSVHLTEQLGPTWAREVLLDELIDAYREPTEVWDLRDVPEVAVVDDLYESIPGERTGRLRLRFDLALRRLPAICDALPLHAPGARRLRTLQRRLLTTSSAGQWIDELTRNYDAGVDRLRRCRDAAAHGGPANPDVVASVRGFANSQAARVTSTAIWATVRGENIREAHDRPRAQDTAWRATLDGPEATLDLLVDAEI